MDSDERGKKSRSQVKREFRELKDLGKQLAGLPPRQLDAIPLSETARGAIVAARKMIRSALSRQYRYISSLLADEDVVGVRAALGNQLQPHVTEVAGLHEAEAWRERLLSGGEAQIAALVEQYPDSDRRLLRQLVRNAKKEREQARPPKSSRELFRYLKKLKEEVG